MFNLLIGTQVFRRAPAVPVPFTVASIAKNEGRVHRVSTIVFGRDISPLIFHAQVFFAVGCQVFFLWRIR